MQYKFSVWSCKKIYKYEVHLYLHATKINSLKYMYEEDTHVHSKSNNGEEA